MNMYVKELLAKDFVKNLEKELIEAVKKSPEEWDGVELRWLLKDKTAEHVWYGMIDKRNKRYKDYKNFVLVNNL